MSNKGKSGSKKIGPGLALAAIITIGAMTLPSNKPDDDQTVPTTQPTVATVVTTAATVPMETTLPTEAALPTEAVTEATIPTTLEPTTVPETIEPIPVGYDYVLNTHTMKFHYPRCSSVKDILPENRKDFHGQHDQVIAMGYKPCKRCH